MLLSACGGNSVPSVPATSQDASDGIQSTAINAAAVEPNAVSVTYSCSTSVGSTKLSASVTGSTPKSVPPGTAVSMTGVQFKVTIPGSFVDILIKNGLTSVSMEATELDINATDAKPGTVNAANPPITYGPVTLGQSEPAVFYLPQSPITVGTWNAVKKGKMIFTAGNAQLLLTAGKFDAAKEVKMTCTAAKATLSKTTVS